MSKYVRQVIYDGEFDGDTVKVFLRPISFVDELSVEDCMPELPPKLDTPERVETWIKSRFVNTEAYKTWMEVQEKRGRELLTLTVKLLSDYITDVQGLFDAAGVALGKDEMLRDAYFIGLTTKIFNHWYKAKDPQRPARPTSPTEEDSKESDQSQTSVTGATVG